MQFFHFNNQVIKSIVVSSSACLVSQFQSKATCLLDEEDKQVDFDN